MAIPGMIALAISAFAALLLVGAGPAILLAPRAPRDAQFALAAVLAAACLICSSQLVAVGVNVRVALVGSAVIGCLLTLVARRRLTGLLRAGAIPTAVAFVAFAAAAGPSFVNGSWQVTSFENTDPYLWVSEAQAFLHGPAPAPSSEHPDRKAFEAIAKLNWQVGLPVALAAVAWPTRSDPKDVYGLLSALIAVLLTSTTYFVARFALELKKRAAAVAAFAIAANSFLMYGSFYGWQAQVLLTAFGVGAVFVFRCALDPDSRRREQLLAALLFAAAVATYGLVALTFVALAAAAAIGLVMRRDTRRRVVEVAGRVALLSLALAPVAVVRSILRIATIHGQLASKAWEKYAPALPSEALGLVPRAVTRPTPSWTVVATVLAIPVFVFAWRRRDAIARADALVGGCAFLAGALILLQLPIFSPYASIKIAGYGAPLFVLLAVLPYVIRTRSRPLSESIVLAAVAVLFITSSAIMLAVASPRARTPPPLGGLERQLANVPRGAPLTLTTTDQWDQAWIVYALRNRRLWIQHPREYLTGFGRPRDMRLTTHRPSRLLVSVKGLRVRAGRVAATVK